MASSPESAVVESHAGGTTTKYVNQKQNGYLWVPIGVYSLAPGSGHKVVLSNQVGCCKFVHADAARFVLDPTATPEVIVDNTAASFTGTWDTSTWDGGGRKWAADFRLQNAGSGTATWTPTLSAAGRYRVYARWSEHSNRAPDAEYAVTHAGGTTDVTVDQRVNGGQWMPLGDFEMAPSSGHKVVLTASTGGVWTVADAVRFARMVDSRVVQADAVRSKSTTPRTCSTCTPTTSARRRS